LDSTATSFAPAAKTSLDSAIGVSLVETSVQEKKDNDAASSAAFIGAVAGAGVDSAAVEADAVDADAAVTTLVADEVQEEDDDEDFVGDDVPNSIVSVTAPSFSQAAAQQANEPSKSTPPPPPSPPLQSTGAVGANVPGAGGAGNTAGAGTAGSSAGVAPVATPVTTAAAASSAVGGAAIGAEPSVIVPIACRAAGSVAASSISSTTSYETLEETSSKKVADLRWDCLKCNLSQKGNKPELVQRLQDHYESLKKS